MRGKVDPGRNRMSTDSGHIWVTFGSHSGLIRVNFERVTMAFRGIFSCWRASLSGISTTKVLLQSQITPPLSSEGDGSKVNSSAKNWKLWVVSPTRVTPTKVENSVIILFY